MTAQAQSNGDNGIAYFYAHRHGNDAITIRADGLSAVSLSRTDLPSPCHATSLAGVLLGLCSSRARLPINARDLPTGPISPLRSTIAPRSTNEHTECLNERICVLGKSIDETVERRELMRAARTNIRVLRSSSLWPGLYRKAKTTS
jgi:hypothetical protein